MTERDWLRKGPLALGITAGASTPNNKIGEALARVLTIRGVLPDAETPEEGTEAEDDAPVAPTSLPVRTARASLH